jgi:uncharacterized OsmC-like protein
MSDTSTLVKVSASGKWISGVETELIVRDFSPFVSDEPVFLGGTDKGPNPMEYVVGAFIGCYSVMISLIAQEFEFIYNGVEFDSAGIIDTRGLMGVEGVSPHFQKIRLNVKIETSEEDERLVQLQESVEKRCPAFNLFKDAGIPLDVKWVRK